MTPVIVQMAALICAGIFWRFIQPGGIDPEAVRGAIAALVYYMFLPALILKVLWIAPLGVDSLKIAAISIGMVLFALAVMLPVFRFCNTARPVAGAMLLVGAFPNVTYMGLPLLENLFGGAGRQIAIQMDLFGCTPLLLTLGIWLAQRFGEHEQDGRPALKFMRVPAIQAGFAAVILNITGVPLPEILERGLEMPAAASIPLMLVALGMSLRPGRMPGKQWLPLIGVVIMQLLVLPLWVLLLGRGMDMNGVLFQGVVLEAAMPGMVLGIVFCDRFGLDTELYAMAVFVTTALSVATLPLWFGALQWLCA